MPVPRLHEGRFHVCHRCWGDLGPADVLSEEASIPFSVERARSCGHRFSGQLLGDPSGIAEMQRSLALPGDGPAQRYEHRSPQLGELQPGLRRPGA